MNKFIVLHDRYSNEPMVVFTSKINALQTMYDAELSGKDERVTYCNVYVQNWSFNVKESMADVMRKLTAVEEQGEHT